MLGWGYCGLDRDGKHDGDVGFGRWWLEMGGVGDLVCHIEVK